MNAALELASGTQNAFASPELSLADFATIAKIVQDLSGIQLSERKLGLVKSRLQKRLRVQRLSDFGSYIRLVQSPDGRDELEELICAISTNVTGFNREPHHFTHFRENLVEKLAKKLTNGESVRIWSAGCSNGSEAHTIACAMLDAFPKVANYDFRILATDIDKYSLNVGRSGLYSADMVSKMPSNTLSKWFKVVDGSYQLAQAPRDLVSFKHLNLMNSWPLKRKYDAIFCRNVLIYFSHEDQEKLFNKFADHLLPEGQFFIGHSERVIGSATDKFKSIGSTTYERTLRGSN
ncbi:protein-glutamate O-methyltransferase CheR [Ahrensia sp. 13_GOM-1096m]|uniref:CheR family methyltransferase n=1 Tax=Ahrensia sp. 13_GOM-1096m TaxID=1380380 RepID=UPI000556D06C|nr:CheR family methyltransferase [Ahrensia sp. 13_GOM-1096m]